MQLIAENLLTKKFFLCIAENGLELIVIKHSFLKYQYLLVLIKINE